MSGRWRALLFSAWVVAGGPAYCVGCTGSAEEERASSRGNDDASPPSSGASPAYDYRQHRVEYSGPGRDDPPPQGLTEVRLGWFGPATGSDESGTSLWKGASLAIEEANAGGGYQGLPFRLLPAWSENPWGSGVGRVTELVYRDGVWALLGGPDSASAHLVEQIVAKARLAFLSPATTEESTNLVNLPWMFSLAPGDGVIAEAWAVALSRVGEEVSTVLVSGTDHESRRLTAALLDALKTHAAFPRLHIAVRPGDPDLEGTLRRLGDSPANVILVVADALETPRIVLTLRALGAHAPIFAGPRAGQAHGLRSARARPRDFANVFFPVLWEVGPRWPVSEAFARRFRDRYGAEPDYTAAYAYDAAELVVEAIRTKGLNRARLADGIRELDGFAGVSGPVYWDPTGRRRATANDIRFARVLDPDMGSEP